jgi:serine protease Do
MVIVSVNRHPVRNVAEFRTIVAGIKPGDDVVFELVDPQHPKGGSSYVGGTLR